MTYKIYALTSYGREEIDEASTFEEASFLLEQYQSAFGAEKSMIEDIHTDARECHVVSSMTAKEFYNETYA